VISVEQDPAPPFADVKVAPTAQLNRSLYMLLGCSAASGYGELVPALEEGSELNDAEVQAVEAALQDADADADAQTPAPVAVPESDAGAPAAEEPANAN
jgi:rod shape-determining protein MreC